LCDLRSPKTHSNSTLTSYLMNLLKFAKGNGKLTDRLIFSIPAGYTCPYAGVCRTYANRDTGKIMDHPGSNSKAAEYRCFAAMAEVRPNVRDARWYNYDLLRESMYTSKETQDKAMGNLILSSLDKQPEKKLIRVHESGDFWTENYLKAWINVANELNDRIFYAYTKSLNSWLHLNEWIPKNLYLTASHGGALDDLILAYPKVFFRVAYVVYSEEEAEKRGLEIDHDDSLCLGDKSFALLVHGSQRAGSEASKAISKRKKEGGFVGYSKK